MLVDSGDGGNKHLLPIRADDEDTVAYLAQTRGALRARRYGREKSGSLMLVSTRSRDGGPHTPSFGGGAGGGDGGGDTRQWRQRIGGGERQRR